MFYQVSSIIKGNHSAINKDLYWIVYFKILNTNNKHSGCILKMNDPFVFPQLLVITFVLVMYLFFINIY